MIAILTILVALPLGLLVRNRLAAYLIYAILFAQVFTFQTATLMMEWVKGSTEAFPADPTKGSFGYLAFTSTIYAVGFGLITLAHWLRNRRRTGTDESNAVHATTSRHSGKRGGSSMELKRRAAIASGAILLALATSAGLAGPAAAETLEHEHFTDSRTDVVEDFCGAGITVQVDFQVEGNFVLHAKGPEGLVYSQAASHGTATFTNLANGNQITNVFNSADKDRRVTDNGDGTLTILVAPTGGDKWYDSDGKLVFQDSGGLWTETLVDDGGTPTDPSDDEFISAREVKDPGKDDLTDDNFCDQILSVIG